MSFWGSFSILQGLGVLYLLVLFPFDIVLLDLLAGPPTWRMLDSGHVVDLVTAAADVGRDVVAGGAFQAVHWVSGSGPQRKTIRLNRKTPAHLVVSMVQSRPRVWKRLRHVGLSSFFIPDHKRRRGDQDDGGYIPAQVRTGVG